MNLLPSCVTLYYDYLNHSSPESCSVYLISGANQTTQSIHSTEQCPRRGQYRVYDYYEYGSIPSHDASIMHPLMRIQSSGRGELLQHGIAEGERLEA